MRNIYDTTEMMSKPNRVTLSARGFACGCVFDMDSLAKKLAGVDKYAKLNKSKRDKLENLRAFYLTI